MNLKQYAMVQACLGHRTSQICFDSFQGGKVMLSTGSCNWNV